MKNPLRLSLMFGCLVLLLSIVGLWLHSTAPAPEINQVTHPQRSGENPKPEVVSDQPALGLESPPEAPAPEAPPSIALREDSSEFERFNDWAARYLAASEEDRPVLLGEGMKIAQVRRTALLKLIETDPRKAIENAVPPVLRQQLPAAIAELLEERVNEKAFYGVLGVMPTAQNPVTSPYRREVRTEDGGRYRAFVYGRRLSQPTTENASIVGIAVDDMMAINERPLRTVVSGEIPNHPNNLTRRRTVTLLDEQGFISGRELQTSHAPAHEVVETCPISGEATEKNMESVAVTAEEIVVEAGGQFHFLCRGGHIEAFEEQLSREGGNGGPSMPTSPPSATQATGYKTHLLMRIAFPEALKGIMTEKEGHDYGKGVQDWFSNSSYGAMTFMTTVTPLIVMPRSEAWYRDQDTDGGATEVLTDARVAAKAAGYDPANFNFDTVIYNGPGSFGGQAYVGGKGCWMRTTSIGVACHEYGHNFGLWHANYWETTNGSAISGGTHKEYGDSFDTMGSASAGDYHFNAYQKNLLNWMPTALVNDVTTSGTYRIYQMDQPVQNPRLRYAIKTRKDADRDYWVDFRQLFTGNAWVQGGVFVHWSPWASSARGSHLLDATPGSIDGKNDATVVIGRTFSDPETGIHITPISKNATTPPSADVVVNLGMFPGNQAPVVAVGASATGVATSVAVDFTATASDPNGDVLSYAWDFGDKSFSTRNSPTVSKSWASTGEYHVRCTVSDMKGKTASMSVIVTVGSPTTFRIAGTITAAGQPLPNVRVHNSKTGTSYREAYTDANGSYTLVGLAAGTYTVATQLYGYTLTPTGSASVTVGPNRSGMNFTAADKPGVSVAVLDADCSEGANTGSFRISRTGSSAAALTVIFNSSSTTSFRPGGSALQGTDYTVSPAATLASPFYTFTIPAGQAFLDVVVTANVDSSVESFESVILELVPSTSYVLGDAAATLWIADGNTLNPLVRLRVTDRDADESGDPGQFVIERIGSTTAALNVSVTITGTATNGTDYVSIPTSITIPAGASSVPVNVTPIQDTLVESMETVILTISTNAAYTRPSSSEDYAGTVNLHDDDQPILTLVATDSSASEAGNDPGVFTITRTGSTAAALTLNYGLTGSALHGTDYVALPGVLTIPAGSSVGTVVITPIDDTIGEPAQTAVLQLRGGLNYTVGAPSNATVTITDDDLPYASIAVTTGPAIEGGTAGVFRVTTTGTGTGNITVKYTVSGTATNGVDYTALTGTLSIPKNTTGNITISTIQDTFVEGYETVTITLDPDPAYTLAVDSSAAMNIQDDDAPQVNVSSTDDTFTETNGSLAKFFVSRTGATTNALTVNYTLGGTATSGSDYTTPSGSVTIAAGAAGAFVNISMLDDALAEGTETIVLNAAPGSGYAIGNGSATRYITDAELASVSTQVRFSAATSSAAESAGIVNIPVTLSAAAAGNVTVEYYINGGTALGGGIDYQLAEGMLTFLPGETSKNISVAIMDDTLPESSETLIIALRNSFNSKLGTSSHTLTITDNDTPPGATVGFAGTTGSGLESQSPAPLTVALSRALGTSATVNYAITGGTATAGSDYTISAGTLTFAAGETVKVIPNTITNDTSAESNETIILTLSSPVGAALNANSVFTYTITDDDAATVTLVATDADAAEPGTDTGLYTVTRTGSTTSALTVNFGITGSATSGADYLNLPTSVVIAAGASSATVLVTPVDDTVIEPTETVILTLTPGVYTLGVANSATVSIADDDSITVIACEIAVEQPVGTDLTDGSSTISCGSVVVGSPSSPLTFTVKNTGNSELTGLALSKSGTNDADYALGSLGATTLAPGASTTFTVTFAPGASGVRTAAIHLASNDADENPFDINLTGTGNTPPLVNAGPAQHIYMAPGSWSPLALNPGLWLDAADDATITLNGATVSQWADKSAFSRNATASGTAQPTATAAGLNGKRVLTFDGGSDVLSVNLDFLAGVNHSAFIVTKPTIYSNIYGAANGSQGASSLHVGFTSATNYRMNYWANDYGPALTSNFSAGSANLMNYVWTAGAGKQILANGKSEGANTSAGVIGTMSGGGRIGRAVGQPFFGGDIAEIIMVTGAVSTGNRQETEGYLAHKWGLVANLPNGHPYKATSPEGASAVTALAGSASDPGNDPLTFLWTLQDGPAAASFADATALDTTVTFTQEGVYTLRLTADDGFDTAFGEVVITVGPIPVDHFGISGIPAQVTVGTPITGITLTALDAADQVATGFTGTVTFGGTGGFSGTSASFTAGVLSNVSVTPTVAGSDLTFTVDDGEGHTGMATIATIQTVYDGWSGNLGFTEDSNGDGVPNGLAWVLGAVNANANAVGLLPTLSTGGGNMLFTFKRSQSSINANTEVSIEVGSTLGSWPDSYTVGGYSTPGVTVVKDTPAVGTDTVTLSVPQSPDPKKFARLKVIQTP